MPPNAFHTPPGCTNMFTSPTGNKKSAPASSGSDNATIRIEINNTVCAGRCDTQPQHTPTSSSAIQRPKLITREDAMRMLSSSSTLPEDSFYHRTAPPRVIDTSGENPKVKHTNGAAKDYIQTHGTDQPGTYIDYGDWTPGEGFFNK